MASTTEALFDIDYFDRLREEAGLRLDSGVSAANPSLFNVTDVNDNQFQLAQLTTFLPFSDGTHIFEAVEDDLAVSLLSIYHFNNPELSPHLRPEDLEGCNIKLTAEFFDTKYSPIDSTRLFTSILQRESTLEKPSPAGLIGAYRSAVTSPLAILTGVNEIPQVSYGSTSTDFNVKEQYPLFGRTIQSSIGEAQVGLDYFLSLNATHIGVLFVTDAFGSALQKAFQDAASEAGIITDSFAFSFSADPNGAEIPNAVESLAKTQFRLFFVIAFENHFDSIMKAAYERNLIGNEYLWIFDGMSPQTFHRNAHYPPESALAMATPGVGVLTVAGGLRTEIIYPGVNAVPPLMTDPISSYERYRTAWREAIADNAFDQYARERFPESVKKVAGFDENYILSPETSAYAPYLYDAITGLGLAYCHAANATAKFNAQNVFDQFRILDFEGATGQVKILSESGTRDYRTQTFVLLNVQPFGLDANGDETFKLVPTNFYQGEWKQVPVEGQVYVYNQGSTVVPASLPGPDFNMNYIGNTGRAVGYSLMGIVVAGSVLSIFWLIWFRRERVIRSSQHMFLLMVAFGALVMASSIVPLSLEEPVSERGLDIACMSAPWLYLSGSIIALSALLAKTRVVHKAYSNPELDFIHVTSFDIFGTFFLLYLVNLPVLLSWTFVSPLEWRRIYRDSTDMFDRPFESYGICSNNDSLPYVLVVLILNVAILIVANWWAYQSRNIETEYQESRYIGISMASILQAWCMGIPILIVVWDNPQAKFFVEAGIIFVTSLAVLLLIFIPKILAIRTDRVKAVEESKRLAYTNFTARSRRNDYDLDEDEEKDKQNQNEIVDDSVGKETSDSSPEGDAAATVGTPKSSQDKDDQPEAPNDAPAVDKSLNKSSVSSNHDSGSVLSMLPFGNSFRNLQFSGLMSSEDAGKLDGLRITHNPRSVRNLQVSGGIEYSRAQMEHLQAFKHEEEGEFELEFEEEEEVVGDIDDLDDLDDDLDDGLDGDLDDGLDFKDDGLIDVDDEEDDEEAGDIQRSSQ